MATQVNERSNDVTKMGEQWPVIEALMGGTPAMRAAGKMLLPKWPNEEEESYDARLATATLFPAYRRTVSVMAGKPFSKELILSKDAPPEIVEWSADIDKQGVNLHAFAAEMFLESFYGFCGILVETPKAITGANGGPPTVEDQKKAGIRPYWLRIPHNQILGWRTKLVNGKLQLTQLRIAEAASEDDGDFGEKQVERVRVLTPGAFSVYEKKKDTAGKESWVVVDEGTTGLDFIPFVPVYGFRKAFMIGEPPLRELAFLNVKHWQSQSDQDTILHVARVPILFIKMFGENAKITVGASAAIKADHPEADAKFVEHTGASITAGKESLQDLEAQMIQAGAELLVAKPGNRTATEDENDAEGNKCDLQRMAEGFEDALDLALIYTAKYANLTTSGNVSLFKDYGARSLSDASAQLIVAMQQAGLITKETALREQQRRGVLSPDIDPEVELAKANEEGPALGTMTDPGTKPTKAE